jgi:hypothetical protein
MCSLAGSSSIDKAYELYKLGLDRGYQSSGFLGVTKNNFVLLKQKEVFELDYLKEEMKDTEEFPIYCICFIRGLLPIQLVKTSHLKQLILSLTSTGLWHRMESFKTLTN